MNNPVPRGIQVCGIEERYREGKRGRGGLRIVVITDKGEADGKSVVPQLLSPSGERLQTPIAGGPIVTRAM